MRLAGLPPPNSQAVRSVLSVIRTNGPIHTRDIYKQAIVSSTASASSSSPTEGTSVAEESPLKSMRYLKHSVLRHLETKHKIEKYHQKVKLSAEEQQTRLAQLGGKGKKKKSKSSVTGEVSVWLWRMKEKESVEQKGKEGQQDPGSNSDTPQVEKTVIQS